MNKRDNSRPSTLVELRAGPVNLQMGIYRLALLISALGMALMSTAAGAVPNVPVNFPVRTQTIELKAGWNAVFLEVEPLNTDPAVVFADSPIDVAAQFTRAVLTTQFATDPQEILANNDGWAIWYAPDREEGFLSGLHALHSHNAFLLHSKRDFQWRVTGQVYLKRITWKADSFNLVGFPVSSSAAPTFAEYFKGIPAHAAKPVFRIVDGVWRKVENPAGTLMRRGEAYWVYCEGGSDFQGPCEVRLAFGDHLRYAPDRFNGSLVLRNRSPHPLKVTLSQVGQGGLPLEFVFKGVLETEVQTFAAPLPPTYQMPSMEPGMDGAVTLRLVETESLSSGGTNVLRVTSDAGTEYWVAIYLDLQG